MTAGGKQSGLFVCWGRSGLFGVHAFTVKLQSPLPWWISNTKLTTLTCLNRSHLLLKTHQSLDGGYGLMHTPWQQWRVLQNTQRGLYFIKRATSTITKAAIIHSKSVNTFSKVLGIVVVDLAQASVRWDQVFLGAAKIDFTLLRNNKQHFRWKFKAWSYILTRDRKIALKQMFYFRASCLKCDAT